MNHHHRQFMQYLRAGGWVKVTALPPAPRVKIKLLALGWIERRGSGSDIYLLPDDRPGSVGSENARIFEKVTPTVSRVDE